VTSVANKGGGTVPIRFTAITAGSEPGWVQALDRRPHPQLCIQPINSHLPGFRFLRYTVNDHSELYWKTREEVRREVTVIRFP
jgi:hypothetical protein